MRSQPPLSMWGQLAHAAKFDVRARVAAQKHAQQKQRDRQAELDADREEHLQQLPHTD